MQNNELPNGKPVRIKTIGFCTNKHTQREILVFWFDFRHIEGNWMPVHELGRVKIVQNDCLNQLKAAEERKKRRAY